MDRDPLERKLAAVLSADAVGYSRLMAADDAATVRGIIGHRERIASLVREHRGRLVDAPGDNLLAEFPSALEAVRCAIEIQRSVRRGNARVPARRRMVFRIGVHLGDVVVEGDRIYGDGVNVAARLERLAQPGEICISGHVHALVARKLRIAQEDLGERRLRNYPEPVRVHRLLPSGRAPHQAPDDAVPAEPTALAVLPFDAFGGSEAESRFADGLVEDLTTRLAGVRGLAVIARTTAFSRRGRPTDLRRVGRELGARFLVEGSVRRTRARLRASVQLIDAASGHHLWARNFDRAAGEALALQDELAADVVAAMRPVLARVLAAESAAPPASGSAVEAALLGRAAERAQIGALLARGLAGRGCVVLVSGEAGVGKSRLAEEVLLDAERDGARALVGRCHRGEGVPAHWPWIEILRELARDPDAAAVLAAQRAREPVLERLLANADRPAAHLSVALAGDSAGPFRLFAATTHALVACAQRQPLVLLFEDLHAADPASLRLLEFVAARLRNAPLSILATHRPAERDDLALAATLVSLSGEGHAERVELAGLSREDSHTLVARVAGSLDADSVDAICAQCEGNPLYLGELARHAAAAGAARRLQIPSTVRETIRERLGAQPTALLGLLAAAAVASPRLEAGLLAEVADVSPDDARRALDLAAQARIVRATTAAGGYRFAHPLLRETIYAEIPEPERVRLHARVADALERRLGGDAGPHVAELAHHLAAGVPVADWRRALELSLRAGRSALARYAWEEAAAHFERAVALGRLDPDTEPGRRCELLLAMAEAQYRAGPQPATFDAFREAAALARASGDALALGRAALGLSGRGVPFGDDVPRGAPLLEVALDALGDSVAPIVACVLARLASAPALTPAESRIAVARAERAVEIARRAGEAETLGVALLGLRTALGGASELDRRTACDSELVALGLSAGDLEVELQGRYGLLVDALERGDRRSLDREAEAHERIACELRQPFHLWRAARVRALRALLAGDLQGAEQNAQAALRLGQQSVDVDTVLNYGVQIFRVRWAQGRLAELEPQIAAIAAQRPEVPAPRAGLCLIHCETGRTHSARASLDRLMSECADDPPRDPEWTTALVALTESAARLGAQKHAERLQRWLEPYARLNVVVGGTCCFGPGAYYLGLIAATLGRWDEAAAHFEAALALARALDAPEIEARTLLEYGSRALLRAEAAPHRLGRRLLAVARELALAKGMEAIASCATARLEERNPRKEAP